MVSSTSTFSFQSMTSSIPSQTATPTPTCISVPRGKNGYVPEYACGANYNYNPSFAAAIAFAVFFGITTFAHIGQALYYKRMKLCWPLLMGAFWEFASFCVRVVGTRHQENEALASISQILVLLAPMWINAFLYMVMGRMIYFFVPEQKILGIKAIKIAKIFVWLDVASFLTQVGGGVLITPGSSLVMTGIHIYMGGIGFQEACILGFVAIAINFHVTMLQQERVRTLIDQPRNWRPLLYVIYVSLALITMRIIFRLVEFSAGLDPAKNPIPYHEAYFLVLDCLPMMICCILINAVHPGRVLVGENSEFPKGPTRKEKKAIKKARKEAKLQAKIDRKAAKHSNAYQMV